MRTLPCPKCGEMSWSAPKYEPAFWSPAWLDQGEKCITPERLKYTCVCGWIEYAPCKDSMGVK